MKKKYTLFTSSVNLLSALVFLGVIFLNHNAYAQFGPLGTEIDVNTSASAQRLEPTIAMDNDGDFVIAWYVDLNTGDDYDIYAQRFNALGVALGSAFRVNTLTADMQTVPDIAMDAVGNFIITWESESQDGDGGGIYAQRYTANGTTVGTEFKVNTYVTSYQSAPSVSMDSDGDFVITWESYLQDGNGNGIYAQRYSANGTAQGTEFQVNTSTDGSQSTPDVAMDSDGDFVICWKSNSTPTGILAQRYNAAGVAQGGQFQVDTHANGFKSNPAIAMDDTGNFVIVWDNEIQDGDETGIFGQRYNSNGVAQGNEFQANTYTTSFQMNPDVTMDSDGDFVIVWESRNQDSRTVNGIYAQRFVKDGTAQGDEFSVNADMGNQTTATIACSGAGDFVVTWRAQRTLSGVYAQRFQSENSSIPTGIISGKTQYGDINLYPNPAKEFVHVDVEKNASVNILNVSGTIIQIGEVIDNTIDISALKAGVYIIEITTSEEIFRNKLIVE